MRDHFAFLFGYIRFSGPIFFLPSFMVKGLKPGTRVKALAQRARSATWARQLFPQAWETQVVTGTVLQRVIKPNGKPCRTWLVQWDPPVDDTFGVASSRLEACDDDSVGRTLNDLIRAVVVASGGSGEDDDRGGGEGEGIEDADTDEHSETDDDEYLDDPPHLGEAELHPAFDPKDEQAAIEDPGSDLLQPGRLLWTVRDDVVRLDQPAVIHPHIIWRDGLGCENRTPFDFYRHFHHSRRVIKSTVQLTSRKLALRKPPQSPMTVQEYFQLEGIVLVLAKHPRLSVNEAFAAAPVEWEFEASPYLGRYMLFSRYQHLIACLTFAEPPKTAAERAHRGMFWKVQPLIDGHNNRRQSCYYPSGNLVVDETECPWHGRNQRYGEHGCPHCQSIIRKPQGIGVENKDLADADTGIVLRLEPVASAEEMATRQYSPEFGSGTGVLLRLTQPLHATNRHVVADSAFASVKSAVQLSKVGLHFTGAIKRAHARFPKKYILQTDKLQQRGDSVVLTATDSGVPLMAVGWKEGKRDSNGMIKRKMFVTSCGSSAPGEPHMKRRFKIRGPPEDSSVSTYTVPVPRTAVVAEYFKRASKIDEANHLSQGIVRLFERRTHRWEVRYWMVISVGVNIVDAFKAWVYFHPKGETTTFKHFWRHVVRGLLDNTEGTTSPHSLRAERRVRGAPRDDSNIHEPKLLALAPF